MKIKFTPEKIKKIRTLLGSEEKPLPQEQFAREIGVAWQTMNRWERDTGISPSPLACNKIKQIMAKNNITEDDLE